MNVFDDVPNEMRGFVKKEFEANPSIYDLKKERYPICLECESFNKVFKMCKECNCLMPLKTMWPPAKCPLEKW
jgi:hypothetical protein